MIGASHQAKSQMMEGLTGGQTTDETHQAMCIAARREQHPLADVMRGLTS